MPVTTRSPNAEIISGDFAWRGKKVSTVCVTGLRLLLQKRIACAFAPDRAGRAMAADNHDIVREREELVPNRAQQFAMIAARQIGAANRAREQHIAHDCQALYRINKYHVSRGMPRAMQHIECELANVD